MIVYFSEILCDIGICQRCQILPGEEGFLKVLSKKVGSFRLMRDLKQIQ